MKKLYKKHSIITAGFSALGLTIIILGAMLIYAKMWTPFEKISIEKGRKSGGMFIEVSTKVPAETMLEYGTNPLCVNRISMESEKTLHTANIAYILPKKEHFVRVIAITENGKQYESKFLKIH